MKRMEKMALELVEKATHPEGDPALGRAMKAAHEAGFRAARELAAAVCDPGDGSMASMAEAVWGEHYRDEILKLGEEEVQV